MSEKFNLHWSDFQENILSSISNLRQDTILQDVTLVGNDHIQVQAHKFVLSACSNLFKTIFRNNTSQNLVLYLDSLDSVEINLVIDYIYKGEVQIKHEQLENFLALTSRLEIQGLTVNPENDETLKLKGLRSPGMDSLKKDIKDEYEVPIDRNNERSSKSTTTQNKAPMEEVDLRFQEHVFYDNGIYRCSICDMKMQRRHDMRRHLETHLTGLSFDCSACGKTYRSSNQIKSLCRLIHFKLF